MNRILLSLAIWSIVAGLSFTVPHPVWAQAALENPQSGSSHSGIGLVSGWVCDANLVEIVFDGSATFTVAHGTSREDTRSACGDADNGFGLLVNWNLLGDGDHEIRALADSVEFARVMFTVTTLGTEFLRDATGCYTLDDFPQTGTDVMVCWEEPLQGFVIVDVAGGMPPPSPPTGIQDGSWSGTVSGGGRVTFTVQSQGTSLAPRAEVADIPFSCSQCTGMESITFNNAIPISDNSFRVSGSDGLVWTGDFLSNTMAQGTFQHGPFTIPGSNCGTCNITQRSWNGAVTGSASMSAAAMAEIPVTAVPLDLPSTESGEWYFDEREETFFLMQRAADGTLIQINEFRLTD